MLEFVFSRFEVFDADRTELDVGEWFRSNSVADSPDFDFTELDVIAEVLNI